VGAGIFVQAFDSGDPAQADRLDVIGPASPAPGPNQCPTSDAGLRVTKGKVTIK